MIWEIIVKQLPRAVKLLEARVVNGRHVPFSKPSKELRELLSCDNNNLIWPEKVQTISDLRNFPYIVPSDVNRKNKRLYVAFFSA